MAPIFLQLFPKHIKLIVFTLDPILFSPVMLLQVQGEQGAAPMVVKTRPLLQGLELIKYAPEHLVISNILVTKTIKTRNTDSLNLLKPLLCPPPFTNTRREFLIPHKSRNEICNIDDSLVWIVSYQSSLPDRQSRIANPLVGIPSFLTDGEQGVVIDDLAEGAYVDVLRFQDSELEADDLKLGVCN